MTENLEAQANESNPVSNDSALANQSGAPELDHFLQSLVSLANTGIEMDITLTVGGFLVSGVLVSGKRFFDEKLAGSTIGGNVDESLADTFRNYFRSFGKIYDEAQTEDLPLPSFIHLRDARFFHNSGTPIPSNGGVWWRGRISQIQGFHLARLFE